MTPALVAMFYMLWCCIGFACMHVCLGRVGDLLPSS